MEHRNESMRKRLLAALPQPEKLADYREETEVLLARHKRALFWDRVPSILCYVIAFAAFIVNWFWAQKIGAPLNQYIWFWAALAYFGGAVLDLRYRIYRSQVATLKEVKQVQLQILELQASVAKIGEKQT